MEAAPAVLGGHRCILAARAVLLSLLTGLAVSPTAARQQGAISGDDGVGGLRSAVLMLDVKRIRVFREVASCGSFSAAADSLSFTQSAVSQQVAALEREVGAKLLDRTPRGVRLTDAGRALIGHADAILARLESAEDELAALAGLHGGRLRLASFQSAGATLVPRAVAAFHHRHPSVELSMVEAEPSESEALLRAGDIDLALVYDYETVGALSDELELVALCSDVYEAVLPTGHELADKAILEIADIGAEPWVGPSDRSGCRVIVDRTREVAGFPAKVAFEADEVMAAQALVAAGMGVAIEPRLALNPTHPGVVARPLADGPVRRIWVARLRGGYRSPACEAMEQILLDVAAEYGEGDDSPLRIAS